MTWLTTDEAAHHTRRDPHEIRRMAAAGGIPAHKSLGRWRFDSDELDAWIRGENPNTPRKPVTTRPRKRT